jgi:hypothetical protein
MLALNLKEREMAEGPATKLYSGKTRKKALQL